MSLSILTGSIAVLRESLLEKSEMLLCVCVYLHINQIINFVVFEWKQNSALVFEEANIQAYLRLCKILNFYQIFLGCFPGWNGFTQRWIPVLLAAVGVVVVVGSPVAGETHTLHLLSVSPYSAAHLLQLWCLVSRYHGPAVWLVSSRCSSRMPIWSVAFICSCGYSDSWK